MAEPNDDARPLEGEEAFRRFVEAADDLMTVVDRKGRFVYVNPAARRFFGLSPDDCVGRSAFDFVHPEDRHRTLAAFDDWISSERPSRSSFHFENRQLHGDGAVRDVHWTITRVDDREGRVRQLVSIARDVSAARRAERQWIESETRLRAVLKGMLDAVVTIDGHGVVQEASDSVAGLFGYAPEVLVGKNVSILMPEPHRSMHDEYLAHYRETGETWILGTTREFEVVHRDGSSLTCELSVSRVDVPGLEELRFVGSFRDVTARRRDQRALRESERRFRALFDQEFQMVGVLKPDGTVIELNDIALRNSGVERTEALGLPYWQLPGLRSSEETVAAVRGAIEAAAQGRTVHMELVLARRGQPRRELDFSVKPLRDEDGEIEVLITEGRDVTEMKNAQRRETSVLRAFAAIGENAAALAHEIKNTITSVNLALRAVAEKLGEDEQEVLNQLVERMQRLERTLRRTLSLAKPLEVEVDELDLGELARGVARDLAPQAEAHGVTLTAEVDEDCPRVHGDEQLLGEVLTNLAVNALEAVGDDGTVRIEVARGADGRARLRVDDDGPGVSETLDGRLFQPFATSKPSGTGLGLAHCKKVVEGHDGTIRVGRAELGGARFEVALPAQVGPSS